MPKPLSYSRMRMFLACPRQYEFRLKHLPQTGLPAIMVRGKFAHAFYEAYVKRCMDTNSMQCLSDIDDIAKSTYSTVSGASVSAGEPILTPAEWDDVVAKLCRPWAERTAIPVDSVQQVESRFALDVQGNRVDFDADTAFIRGVIDRIDVDGHAFRIVDYKTGYGGTGDPLQADLYAWATLTLTDTHAVTVVFDHTATDYQETYSYTRDDLPRLDAALRALAETIHATKDFRPQPGMACSECPYAYCCDAKAAIPEGITDETEARQAVEAIALLERDLKAAKDALRRYCESFGHVDHNGITWGIWKSDGIGFHDVQEFISCLAMSNMDYYPFLSVNNTKAKRLRKMFPHIVTENPSLSFRSKKSKGEEE